jgi:hypothetical protein
MYEIIQKINVNWANRLVLAGNVVDSGRQSATSQVPKTNAGIEKTPCRMFMINRKGVLEKAFREVRLKGSMNTTAENPTIQASITISSVISCKK